ncbi:MAG: leucyl aminopeptidase family protein [Cytophagales bacterium]
MISLKQIEQTRENIHLVVLYNELKELTDIVTNEAETSFVKTQISQKKEIIILNQYTRYVFLVQKPQEQDIPKKAEKLRRLGFEIQKLADEYKITDLQIENNTPSTLNILDFTEGLLLGSYRFLKYKSDKKKHTLESVFAIDLSLDKSQLKELSNIAKAVFTARDLVNEPLSYLTAEVLSEEIEALGKEHGFKVEVFNKSKIESLKMGGLLAVNKGSKNHPTFNVLEYKPKHPTNEKPIILVGKGVVYDTGGYSLKPADSLDWMKCDMAGAAAVVGTFVAVAENKLPIHIIGLIPATENRLDGNAYVPGDVIEMFDGTTVEVLNTDAEGRLILADALAYAKKYNPQLVFDLATLTGSAMRATGTEGSVYMGTATDEIKSQIEKAGHHVHERLVQFPLWDEYADQLKSDIADFQNIGGSEAGAITAGMFLKHFTSYPWLHFDIAGTAFLKKEDNYRGKSGTGVGVRLLYKYLKSVTEIAEVKG